MAKLSRPSTENGILGTCLNAIGQKSGWFNRIGMYVKQPEDLFVDPRNKAIYKVMRKYYDNDKEPTVQQIIDNVESSSGSLFDTTKSARDYINSLSMNVGVIYNSKQFDNAVEELDEARKKRNQATSIQEILGKISNEDEYTSVDIAKELNDIADKTEVIDETKTFSQIFKEVKERDAPTWRISTNIQRLDQVLGGRGFEAGTLTTIAARPKVGKTVLMNSMMHTVLEHGGIPIALNYETKDIEFLSKMIARHISYSNEDELIEINYDDVGNPLPDYQKFTWSTIKDYLSNDVSQEEEDIDPEALNSHNSWGLSASFKNLIDIGETWAQEQEWFVSFDKNLSMPGIEMLVKKVKEKNVENPRIVLFVDYVQLQVTDASREREQITDLTRFYKKLAGKYNIAVVILAQINREGSDDPQVEHLKSSGSIEQDSDVILLLSKARRGGEILPDHIKVNGGTTRLGQGDIFNVFFDHSLNLVTEADKDREDTEGAEITDYTNEGDGYESKKKAYQPNN